MNLSGEAAAFDTFLEALAAQTLPPVHEWRPSTVRDMDLVIDAGGTWYYQGSPFKRLDLVRLLSGLLVMESGEYFLVSPAEKLRVTVEDAPFVATDFEVGDAGGHRLVVFDTNVGFKVPLDANHPLEALRAPGSDQEIPYLEVRDRLKARVARSVFYRLVELGEEREGEVGVEFGIASGGVFFPLASASWI